MRRQILVAVTFVAVVLMAGTAAFLAISHAGGLVGVQWTQIGPAPEEVDGDQNVMGVGPNSGEIQDIAIDPRSSNQTIFTATEAGGIWESTDGGTTWKTTTDALTSLSMGAVTLDAGNPSVVYAGTGNNGQQGFFLGVGVYVSTDGGLHWTLSAGSGALTGKGIARMASGAANTLAVGTNPGFQGDGSFTNNGVYFSSNAGGAFTKTLSGQIDDLHLDTTVADQVIAAVNSTGLFVSGDGGNTWGPNLWTASNGSPLSVANFTPGFITFAQSTKPNDNTIYAGVANTSGVGAAWGLFVSTDSGANWAQAAATGIPAGQFGNIAYAQPMAVEPNNASIVYQGFINLFVSTNGGASFALADSPGSSLQVHNDWHALTFSPTPPASGNTPLFVGTDGGIATTSDGGGTWSNINGSAAGTSLATTLFRAIDIGRGSPANNKYSYGGMQDTGTAGFRAGDTPTTWHMGNDAGDGVAAAVDTSNPLHVIGAADGCPKYTTNGGNSWTGAGGLVDGPGHTDGMPVFAFGQIDAFDPNNGSNAYISMISFNSTPLTSCVNFGAPASFGLWNSTDGGVTYALMQGFPAQVNAIATVKIDSNTIWLGLNDGTLAFTTNALLGSSATWTAIPSQVAGQGVTGVAIDPTNTKTVVVTYPGFGSHVFITNDSGTTWTDLSAALVNLPTNAVVIDPTTTPHTIIVGNDAGVLQTADMGATWQVLGVGMPTVDVVSLALDTTVTPELLRAGTFGRSVFELAPPTGPLLTTNSTFNFGTLCPGQTPTELLQLFNVGTSDLTITSINQLVPPNTDFTISGPGFPVTISPNAEVDFTIQYTPTLANEGITETATFQIVSNSVVNPSQDVTYTATVGQPKGSTVIASGGAFGNVCVGALADLNLTIANSGTCPLLISGITSSDADFLAPSTLVYPLSVQAGNSLAVPVVFEPLSTGAKSGTITVDSTNNPAGNMPVSVTGTAPQGNITWTGSGVFGTSVCSGGTGVTQTLQIDNTGACNVNVASAVLTGCLPAFTLVNPTNEFPATISPDSGLGVGVNFSPTTQGPQSCNLTITSNADNPVVTIPLSGTEGNGKILVTGSGNFGTEVCGGKAPPQTLKVNNTGPCNLIVTSAVISCPDFTLVNPLEFPATISPDSELDIGVNFTPTSAGPKSCTLTITTNDPINPVVVIPLTATTPLGSAELTFPAGLTFPPTVIQQEAACPLGLGVPVTDGGACPVTMNSVTLTQSSSVNPLGLDYSLTGLPGLPVTLAPGDELGDGDLDVVFEPFTLARTSTGDVNFTFVNDPITGATMTTPVPFCGEAVDRGVRVLVTLGGVPVTTVKKISLQNAYGPDQPEGDEYTIQTIKKATLQTVNGVAPCPSFQFQAEFGGVSNPRQLKLGDYRVKVYLKVGKKTEHKAVRFTMDECSFTPNIVVAF